MAECLYNLHAGIPGVPLNCLNTSRLLAGRKPSFRAWLHCREANDLSLSWGQVDLELWTVLFSGLAKPHCLTCCSPYQKERVCQPTTLVASLKDPCVLSSTDQVAVLSVPVPSHTCAAIAVPPTTLSSPAPPVSQRTAQGLIRVSASATMANDKVRY